MTPDFKEMGTSDIKEYLINRLLDKPEVLSALATLETDGSKMMVFPQKASAFSMDGRICSCGSTFGEFILVLFRKSQTCDGLETRIMCNNCLPGDWDA